MTAEGLALVMSLCRQVAEAEEVSDPAGWAEMIDGVLSTDSSAELREHLRPPASPAEQRLFDEYLSDYHGLKQMLRVGAGLGFVFRWRRPASLLDGLALFGSVTGDQDYGVFVLNAYASDILRAFVRKRRTRAEEVNDDGWAQQQRGDPKAAIEQHEHAIKLSPRFSLAWVNKGIALKNLGQIEPAIACYDHVLQEIDPEYRKAWHNKAVALIRQVELWNRLDVGLLEKALGCLDRAIAIDPAYDQALSLRSRVGSSLAEAPRS